MQLSLYRLMPGFLGGEALRNKRGIDYLRQIAAKGGRTTVNRYGSEYMRELGKRGAAERKRKRENEARTVTHWDGTVKRIIPREKPTSRKHVIEYVQIELSPDE